MYTNHTLPWTSVAERNKIMATCLAQLMLMILLEIIGDVFEYHF
jgi:hypothetical protein